MKAPLDVTMMKSEIRKRIREKQSIISVRDQQTACTAISERLFALPEFKDARTVCVYASMPDEIDTGPIISTLFRLQKTVAVPKVTGDTLSLRSIESADDLVSGAFGIPEPVSQRTIKPDDVDVYIVPGIAFDRSGGRIGRGKGYYDRLLAGLAVYKIGLALDSQIIAKVPTSSYDVSMTAVITQTTIYFNQEVPVWHR